MRFLFQTKNGDYTREVNREWTPMNANFFFLCPLNFAEKTLNFNHSASGNVLGTLHRLYLPLDVKIIRVHSRLFSLVK